VPPWWHVWQNREAIVNYLELVYYDVSELLASGGPVLWVILVATFLMWTLIVERYIYLFLQFPRKRKSIINTWQVSQPRDTWQATQVRKDMVVEANENLTDYLLVIRTLTQLLPVLGLLGTVEGMIQTFNVLSVFGTGNARGLAYGISQALITTMAGLVAALSGLYFSANLTQRTERETQRLTNDLQIGG